VGFAEIRSGQKEATRERRRAQEGALVGQGTSFLPSGALQAQAGLGTVQERTCPEELLPAPGAFPPARVNRGGRGAKLWQRPKQPVGHKRKHGPMEAKGGSRWLAGSA
jgi:hypothetical protein